MEQVDLVIQKEDTPLIEEKYNTYLDLLDSIERYHPLWYETFGLEGAEYVGKGTDAYVFRVGNQVLKFTQSEAHAKVANHLFIIGNPYDNLVEVSYVAHIPGMDLWVIQEEYLYAPSWSDCGAISGYFEYYEKDIPDRISSQLEAMKDTLCLLGVRDWELDCMADHNILQSEGGVLKLFDFGYTESDFDEAFLSWS